MIENPNFKAPNSRVQAEVSYSAPFLTGGAIRSTLFEADNQNIVQVVFPQPPNKPPGRARLSIIAKRKSKMKTANRILKPDETLVLVKVFADARIQIITSDDRVPELSKEGELLARLADLQ